MGDTHVKSDEEKILHFDAKNLYGHSMSQSFPFDQIKFDNNKKLQANLNTPDDSNNGFFVEVDLFYPDEIKNRTENVPLCPEKNISGNFTPYSNEIKPETNSQYKKLICDWSDKMKFWVHFRMLAFYVGHGMIFDKVHEVTPFKQSKWLVKFISFNTIKKNYQKMILKKTFLNYSIPHFIEKQCTMYEIE